MRAAANPARRRANRLTTARALAVSLGLHAAAAAAYGGYQLGYADTQPTLDLGGGGGMFVAISIRGAPGGPAGAPVPPADVVANLEDLLPPVVVTEAVAAPPTPELPPPPPPVVQPPAVIAVLEVAGPALADLASEVSRDVVEVVAASLEGARQQQIQASRPPSPPPGGGGGQGEGRGDGPGDTEAGGAGGGGEGGGSGLGVGRNPLPDYPQAARSAGQEGEVIVLMLCDATGKVQDAWVEKSSGYPLLDEAALAAVKTWTFVPPVVDGKAVSSYVRRPIGFKLVR